MTGIPLRWRAWLLLILLACGTDNKAKPYSPLTKDQQAREALDAEDFETAVKLYGELIADEPEEYSRYPLHAAALAALSGLDIFSLVKMQFSGSEGGSLLDAIGGFVPEQPTDEQEAHLQAAVSRLEGMPADKRSEKSEEKYGASAALQLSLYSAAHAAMVIKRFADITTGTIDVSKITEEDAVAVIDSLLGASEAAPDTAVGQVFKGNIDQLRQAIDQTPGETTREKLANYLGSNNQ